MSVVAHEMRVHGCRAQLGAFPFTPWLGLGENFPWHKSPTRRGPHEFRKNPYEFANNYYPGEIKGLADFLKKNRPVDGRQGDPYMNLNQGDMSKKQP